MSDGRKECIEVMYITKNQEHRSNSEIYTSEVKTTKKSKCIADGSYCTSSIALECGGGLKTGANDVCGAVERTKLRSTPPTRYDTKEPKRSHSKVSEFITLDDQLLSVVANVGFCRFREHLEPMYELPSSYYFEVYNKLCDHLLVLINDVPAFGISTDIWRLIFSLSFFFSSIGSGLELADTQIK